MTSFRNPNTRIRKTISHLYIDTADVSLVIADTGRPVFRSAFRGDRNAGCSIEKQVRGYPSEFIECDSAADLLGVIRSVVGET